MSDPFRKVQPGQRFEIPAAAYNAFVDAALAHQQSQQIGVDAAAAARYDLVLVRNDSGSAVARGGVLGITGTIITPSYLDEFKARVTVIGVVPVAGTHEGRFVVAAEPIAIAAIGRAFAAGVCQAMVQRVRESHRFCDAAAGDITQLVSGPVGAARILYAEASNPGWAIVQLGHSSNGLCIVEAMQDAPAAAALSVKHWDTNAYGDAFNALTIDGGNWSDKYPGVANGSRLFATRIGVVWYGVGFSYVAQCP